MTDRDFARKEPGFAQREVDKHPKVPKFARRPSSWY